MSVKLRLQRQGRKKQPFYYIVVADSRAPRDGRFIDRVGSYNPNTDPATINLDIDRSVDWLRKGAQPSDTVRAILSYKGVLYKNHLLKGVTKGVMTEEQANEKFMAWEREKESKIQNKRDSISESQSIKKKEDLEREAAIRAEREKAILAKSSPMAEEVATENAATEDAVAEAPAAEEPAAEEPAAEAPVAEEPAAEAPAAEAPAAEEPAAEEPVAEAPAAEEPVAEEPVAEEPAAETSEEEPKAE